LQFLPEQGAATVAQRKFIEQILEIFGMDPMALIRTQSAGWNQIMDVRVINKRAAPGVQDPEQSQLRAQPFGIATQFLESLGAGFEQQRVGQRRMRAHPASQRFGHGEGDQEITHWQEQPPALGFQPLLRISLAAERTVTVVAGMVTQMITAAGWAPEQLAAQRRSATAHDLLQDLALSQWHLRAKAPQVLRRLRD